MLRGGHHRRRTVAGVEHRPCQPPGQPAETRRLGGDPGVQFRRHPGQIGHQVRPVQIECLRLAGPGAGQHRHVGPQAALGQGDLVAVGDQQRGAPWPQRRLQLVPRLPQRGARLFRRPSAPEQRGQLDAQHRARRVHRQHREQRAGLAGPRQHRLAGHVDRTGGAEQGDGKQRRQAGVGGRRVGTQDELRLGAQGPRAFPGRDRAGARPLPARG